MLRCLNYIAALALGSSDAEGARLKRKAETIKLLELELLTKIRFGCQRVWQSLWIVLVPLASFCRTQNLVIYTSELRSIEVLQCRLR